MIKNISNLGDAALYCDFGNSINKELNTNVIRYFKDLKSKNINGITNITPSYNKLIISFDLKKTNYRDLKKIIENINLSEKISNLSNKIEIPVCCQKTFALDIERLEEKLSIDRKMIYQNFFNKEYICYMTGFIAGMPFLGDLDINMRTTRLETPRVKVPKGSIGLTEQFANIYTFESPGGWNIIGKTPLEIFDTSKNEKPNLINPGDIVIFKEISINEYNEFK